MSRYAGISNASAMQRETNRKTFSSCGYFSCWTIVNKVDRRRDAAAIARFLAKKQMSVKFISFLLYFKTN